MCPRLGAPMPNDPTDKYVGSRIRMRRLTRKMSQAALGDAVGVTFQQIQKYEKGTNRIGSSRLQRVANVLKVPVSYFFDGGPNSLNQTRAKRELSDYTSEFLATPDGLALTRAFLRLPKGNVRRAIVKLVEKIAEHR